MSQEYNFIYNQLVKDHDDVAGILAYSVYKRQKIEHIKENGENSLDAFRTLSNSPSQLEFYRNEAATILQQFAETYLEEDLKEREAYFENAIAEEIKGRKPKFWTGVWQSVVGSYVFIMTLGILFFILWASKVGVVDLIEIIFNVTITANQ